MAEPPHPLRLRLKRRKCQQPFLSKNHVGLSLRKSGDSYIMGERERISKSFVNDAKQESSLSILRNQQNQSHFDSCSIGFSNLTLKRLLTWEGSLQTLSQMLKLVFRDISLNLLLMMQNRRAAAQPFWEINNFDNGFLKSGFEDTVQSKMMSLFTFKKSSGKTSGALLHFQTIVSGGILHIQMMIYLARRVS